MSPEDIRLQAAIDGLNNFFERHLESRSRALGENLANAAILKSAMEYSLFSGGKRFRPQVAFLTAELLEMAPERVVAHAAAVELVHTYSLIHDDLPCMDDDTFRRGVYTNHILYGEDKALLAGDALLTEAFDVLATHYSYAPEIGLELTRLLSEAAGFTGMIAGQIADLDLARREHQGSVEKILAMHSRKTGALIRYAAEGTAVVARASKSEQEKIGQFGTQLGLAFQIADDLLDYAPNCVEKNGIPYVLGVKKSRELLLKVTNDCKRILEQYGARAKGLLKIVENNCLRDH